jgi:uracil-DNA glycosylase
LALANIMPDDHTKQSTLTEHIAQARACRLCPKMESVPVIADLAPGHLRTRVMLVGQAPGIREPGENKLFAYTAGTTLFKWMQTYCGVDEQTFRSRVFMAAVCRCFPGRTKTGGDRVPNREEIANCAKWLDEEIAIIRPRLIIALGKLAMSRFLDMKKRKLVDVVGNFHNSPYPSLPEDCQILPLPHPSGASTWHQRDPGKSLLIQALSKLRDHPAFGEAVD